MSCNIFFSFIPALNVAANSWAEILLLAIAWRSEDALTAGPPSWAWTTIGSGFHEYCIALVWLARRTGIIDLQKTWLFNEICRLWCVFLMTIVSFSCMQGFPIPQVGSGTIAYYNQLFLSKYSKLHGFHSNRKLLSTCSHVGQAFPLDPDTVSPCHSLQEEQQALMKFLESMPREVPEVARSMPHWRQRAAAGWPGWETIFPFHLVLLKKLTGSAGSAVIMWSIGVWDKLFVFAMYHLVAISG